MTDVTDWEQERTEVLRSLALIEQALSGLRADFGELRAGLTRTLGEMHAQDEAQQARLNALSQKHAVRSVLVDNLEKSMNLLTRRVEQIEQLVPALRLVMWIGALWGASVVALIWALITGQAQITF
ncbi:MAG: hypothetical protein DRJ03_22325 [Chloroflexi bacterium]|nr:MAG: hypothetical protein DRI81_09495 [Chloroflexota bacterium]RLC80098.1 MAG: hypothetical protein DRJ03_22325 [Chloroflexota bacterium]